MRVWLVRVSACCLLPVVAAGCESDAAPAPVACESDRECADGDPCNGVERCDAGWCVDAPAACTESAQCRGDGECLAPCVGDCGTPARCDVVASPRLRFVSVDAAIPVDWWTPSGRVPTGRVEAALTGLTELPSVWHPVDTDAVDFASLGLEPGEDVVQRRLHLRVVGGDGDCDTPTSATDYTILPSPPPEDAAWPESTLDGLAAHEDAVRVAGGDARIVAWASEVVHYTAGERVDALWQDERLALGPADLDPYDVLSLGEGGEAILAFDRVISNGEGPDFAVFENAVPDNFVEFGVVAVSTDGLHFATFDATCLAPGPVGTYDVMDARLVDGLAGTAPLGLGVAFDLADLRVNPLVLGGFVDLDAIHFVRITDVVGDGTTLDSLGQPIWDPYPTYGSAGFDIDAVAILRQP